MPPLVKLPSPVFLSHSDPPFIYQYVGDQIKILQVLGNYSANTKLSNATNDTDSWDQTKTTDEETLRTEPDISQKCDIMDNVTLNNSSTSYSSVQVDQSDNNKPSNSHQHSEVISNSKQNTELKIEHDNVQNSVNIMDIENTSLETSINENDSADSDDEASYGTPEDSPKAKRKSPKGKYGKAKAPLPPQLNMAQDINQENSNVKSDLITTSQESLNDIINQKPNITIESGTIKGGHLVVNPIAEKKKRHKSKSPNRIPKGHSSGIGKLLQLPTKLAFWHKTDDKMKTDNISSSSADNSRRSSTVENQNDEFENCSDFNLNTPDDNNITENEIADDQISFKDATDVESELNINDILEKSDALQKLIEAKIESHPEYKYVSLHNDLPTTSKSTDV
jgi:hypothetical protein